MKHFHIKLYLVSALLLLSVCFASSCTLLNISDETPINRTGEASYSKPSATPVIYPYKSSDLIDAASLLSTIKLARDNRDYELSDFDNEFCAYILNRHYISNYCEDTKLKAFMTDMYISIVTCQKSYTIDETITLYSNDIKNLLTLFLSDCPEIFHLNGGYKVYTYADTGRVNIIEFDYIMSISSYYKKLSKTFDEISYWAAKTKDMGAFPRELYIYDKILNNCRYVDSGKEISSAYGAIIAGKALCEGYSDAFTLAMFYIGIPCIQVCGDAVNNETNITEPHAWNLVCIDNDWYQVDPTWDDYNQSKLSAPTYAYMNMSDESSANSRTIDELYKKFTLPKCVSTTYNYHVFFNLMINQNENVKNRFNNTLDTVIGQWKNSHNSETASITLKLETKTQYYELLNNCSEWIKEWNRLQSDYVITSIVYSYDVRMLVIRYDFTVSEKN